MRKQTTAPGAGLPQTHPNRANAPEPSCGAQRFPRADQVILGDSARYSTDSQETGLNNNILVVGDSGSGKTVSLGETLFLESFQRSIIAIVTKRQLVTKYTPLLQSRGYDVLNLNFLHPEEGNVGYDPLDCITSFQDIRFIGSSIVMSDPRKKRSVGDPYWDQAAISLLTAIITYVLMTKPHPNFDDVLQMAENLSFSEAAHGRIQTNYDQHFRLLGDGDAAAFARSNWMSFRQLPMETAGCVFGMLNTTLNNAFSPELRAMFRRKKKLSFERLAEKRTVLFVITSPVNDAIYGFVSLFYAQAFKELFEYGEEQPDGKLPIPVHLLADDFATGAPVPDFEQHISIFREKQLSVTLMIQSESQLVSLYGADAATTIINNCDTYVFMGGNDLRTAQSVALRTGKPLEEVLQMKLGQQILCRRGSKPVLCRRYHIFQDETYRTVTAEYERQIAEAKMRERSATGFVH